MKILVVDDDSANRSLTEMYVKMLGHQPLLAADGESALKRYQEEAMDMVLMDVTLPDMNGYEVTREIRKLAGSRWVPILFVSACNELSNIQQGIDAGGDDYLTKPIDFALFSIRIGALQRIAEMQHELEQAHLREMTHRRAMDTELELARNLIEHMTSNQMVIPGLEMWQLPASTFNGDLMLTSKGAGGEIYLLHADSMGHGLTAALPLLHVVQAFRELTRTGYSLPGLVSAMNRQLRRDIPVDRFVAANLVRIDANNHLIEIWNGGCPPALVIDAKGELVHRFATSNLPLGIQDEAEMELCTEVYHWQEPCRLVVYSDGLTEATGPDGDSFGEARLLAALRWGMARLDDVKDAWRSHMQGQHGHDDISVLVMNCEQCAEATKKHKECET